MSEEVKDTRIAREEKQENKEKKTEPPPKEEKKAIRLRFAKAIPKRGNTAQSWTWGGIVNVFGGKQAHTPGTASRRARVDTVAEEG